MWNHGMLGVWRTAVVLPTPSPGLSASPPMIWVFGGPNILHKLKYSLHFVKEMARLPLEEQSETSRNICSNNELCCQACSEGRSQLVLRHGHPRPGLRQRAAWTPGC